MLLGPGDQRPDDAVQGRAEGRQLVADRGGITANHDDHVPFSIF
jgi:hypothetical protein